jgi:serine/threonine protein kinase
VLYYAFRYSQVFCVKIQSKDKHDIEVQHFDIFKNCSTIIHHEDIFHVKEDLWGIVMPVYPRSVRDLIKSYYTKSEDVDSSDVTSSGIPMQTTLNIFLSIINSLKYFNKENLCHSDIKPANLLLDATGKATLIDLGAVVKYGSPVVVIYYLESVLYFRSIHPHIL